MKMQNIVCDRCNNELWTEGKSGKLKLKWKKHSIKAKITSFFNGNYDGYQYTDKHYNLCDNCRNELINWLDNK